MKCSDGKKDSNDSISVVIPFYAGVGWLEEALESVFEQTLLPDEVIVINDGSDENIDHLVSKYNGSVKFVNQDNRGAASARNKGMKLSTGRYIAFLDSDDLWLPQKLETQLRFMKDRGFYWSHSQYKVFDNETRAIVKSVDNSSLAGMVYPKILARCAIATPCVMIDKTCLNDERMSFNEEMRQGQDYCFWCVLAKRYELGSIDDCLVLVRDHSNNVARNVSAQLKVKGMMFGYLKKHQDYFGNVPAFLNAAFGFSRVGYSISKRLRISKVKSVVSAVLYIIPWSMFHVYYRFADRSQAD